MSDTDSFNPYDPRNPAYRVPIRREQFNTFRFPGFGQDPEIVAPAPAPTPPPATTPPGGGSETPAGLRGAFGVRSREDTQPDDNPSFRGNQPGGGGISLDEMSDAQLLNYVATIGDDPIIGALTSGPSFIGQTFGYMDELNQILTYNARFGTSYRTLEEIRADATARLTNQPLNPTPARAAARRAPAAPQAAGVTTPIGRGVVPGTDLTVPTPGQRPAAPTRAVPDIRGGAIPDSGTPFRPPIPGRNPRRTGESPLEGIGDPRVVGRAPFEPPVPGTRPTPPDQRPQPEPVLTVPADLPEIPGPPARKPEPPVREQAAVDKPATGSAVTSAPGGGTTSDRTGGGFGGDRDRAREADRRPASDRRNERGNDQEDRGSGGGRDRDRGGRDRSRDRGGRGPSGSNRK